MLAPTTTAWSPIFGISDLPHRLPVRRGPGLRPSGSCRGAGFPLTVQAPDLTPGPLDETSPPPRVFLRQRLARQRPSPPGVLPPQRPRSATRPLGRGVRPAVNARCPGKPLAQEHTGGQELVSSSGPGVSSPALDGQGKPGAAAGAEMAAGLGRAARYPMGEVGDAEDR